MDDVGDTGVSKVHVPDKLYGYGLQVRQMLFELLNCSTDSIVSIEKFDDVGVENSEGRQAIQTKSALSDRNPVSDRASDLWKTIYNWLIALKEGELEVNNTIFILVINISKSGIVVSTMNDAHSAETAQKAYDDIKKIFSDQDGNYVTQSEYINLYIETFFLEENKEFAVKIIENFKLVVMDEGHTNKIYQEFKAKTYLPADIQDLVFDKMLGWIEKTTALQLEAGHIMQITKENFNKQLVLTQTLVNQNKCLVELAPNPTNTEIELEQKEYKTYIRQLQIINVDYDDQLAAINDYLRAASNRTMWAVNGDINEDIMEQYYRDLKRRWKTKRNIVEIEKDTWEEEKRGKYLYNLCQDIDVDMGMLVTPHFFTNGCYHELADSQQIGWHPDYQQKLKEDEKND